MVRFVFSKKEIFYQENQKLEGFHCYNLKDSEIKGFDNRESLDWNGLFVASETEYMVPCLTLFGKSLY